MVRTTFSGILVGGIAAAALVAAAAPAAAKCGHVCPDPVRLQATVYDSTWRPMVIKGRDAWRMLNVTGVSYHPYNVWDYPPDRLGPKYRVIYRFDQGDRSWVLYQDVYPYATGRPFAFTPPGQHLTERYGESSEQAADGWRGSRTLESILRAHGLPEAPPVRTETSIQGAATSRSDGSGGPLSGGLLVAALAFLGLAGLTARWGFRRRSSGAPA